MRNTHPCFCLLDVGSLGSTHPTAFPLSVAKNREWFTEYTPFESVLNDAYGMGTELRIQGIGTVELATKKSPSSAGKRSHRTIRLTNVLHAPDTVCNIIGGPLLKDHIVDFNGTEGSKGRISDRNGRSVAYFDPDGRLFTVKLRGPPVGPSAMKHDVEYMISVSWSPKERAKWEKYRQDPPYTTEEKEWLKVHYGGEFHFLKAHGLNIYKDDHREEGRYIVRALMRGEQPEDRSNVRPRTVESYDEYYVEPGSMPIIGMAGLLQDDAGQVL